MVLYLRLRLWLTAPEVRPIVIYVVLPWNIDRTSVGNVYYPGPISVCGFYFMATGRIQHLIFLLPLCTRRGTKAKSRRDPNNRRLIFIIRIVIESGCLLDPTRSTGSPGPAQMAVAVGFLAEHKGTRTTHRNRQYRIDQNDADWKFMVRG